MLVSVLTQTLVLINIGFVLLETQLQLSFCIFEVFLGKVFVDFLKCMVTEAFGPSLRVRNDAVSWPQLSDGGLGEGHAQVLVSS